MGQQRGVKRAAKVLKRKQKKEKLREAAVAQKCCDHDHDHAGHEHKHEHKAK